MLILLLSGCMFPQEKRAENQISNDEQLAAVEQAVHQYREDTAVLPIQTKEAETPIYQKYVINFRELIPRYIQEPPPTAFENGGAYQYVIVDPENKAEVKVIDLRTVQEVQEVQMAVNLYIQENDYAPIEESIGDGLFHIDKDRLSLDHSLTVPSPYHHNTNLPLVMNAKGQVLIDYSIDLNIMLQKKEHDFKPGDDIRPILTDNSPIAPAFSVPYTINKNGDPIFMES